MIGSAPIASLPIASQPAAGGQTGSISFSGSGTFSLDGVVTGGGRVAFSGAGHFSARGYTEQLGQVGFAGAGTFNATGRVPRVASLSFSAAGQFLLAAISGKFGRTAWRGQGFFLGGSYDNVIVDSQTEIETPKGTVPDGLSTTARPAALTFDYRLAYTLGPEFIGLADTGILNWAWYVSVDGGSVKYARSNDAYDGWGGETELFDYVGDYITEIDCAFEQNGRIVVVAERPTGAGGSPEIWLYWYKPSLADFTFERIGAGRSPRVVLDNPNDTTIADVHIAYIRDTTGLVTRRQSELYAIRHDTVFTAWDGWYLEEFARNRGNRLVAILSARVGDRYYLDRVESTLFPIYPRDSVTLSARGLTTSTLADELLYFSTDVESIEMVPSALTSSTLVDILLTHTLYDKDGADLTPSVLTSSDLVTVLLEWLFTDYDSVELVPSALTSSALDIVLIQDDLAFGEDNVELAATVRNTSTLEVP